jgi:hypothetical protein
MQSSDFDPYIEVLDGYTQASLTSATGSGSANLTFTNTGDRNVYYLVLTSAVAGASGHYTFSFNVTYAPNTAVKADLKLPTTSSYLLAPRRVRRANR